MFLVRDVLDGQMLDRNKHRMGKVDGIVLEVREGSPPRVVYLEAGATTLAHRLSRRLGRFADGLARRWGGTHTRAYRIPWTLVRELEVDVTVDLTVDETRLNVVEDWLTTHITERLPGGRKHEHA